MVDEHGCPLKKKSPASTTRPAAGLRISVPFGAAMSMPLCGLRGWPLKTRRSPNEFERVPGTGGGQRQDGRQIRGVSAERRFDALALGFDALQVLGLRIDLTRA